MPLQCAEIETLVQTYLDDELAGEETRDLERHVAGCTDCRQQVAEETRFHTSLRKQLAPPRAPADLRDRIAQALDREDEGVRARGISRRRARGSRWSWVLPGTATLAAAAALLLFVFQTPESPSEPPVAYDAVRQHMRRPPVEVQGAAISPWIRRHFSPQVQVPRFDRRHTNLRGARLSHVRGRDAVQFYYDVARGSHRHEVSMLMFDASDIDFGQTFRRSQHRQIDGREIWLDERLGYGVVAHKSADGIGYLLTSDMDGDQLLDLVRQSDLLSPPRR